MRTKIILSVLVLGGSLVSANAAMAQGRGPPAASSAVILPADSGAQLYDLGRRLQALEQKLSWRTDDAGKAMLSRVNAMQGKVFGEIPPTESEFAQIADEISRLEFALR